MHGRWLGVPHFRAPHSRPGSQARRRAGSIGLTRRLGRRGAGETGGRSSLGRRRGVAQANQGLRGVDWLLGDQFTGVGEWLCGKESCSRRRQVPDQLLFQDHRVTGIRFHDGMHGPSAVVGGQTAACLLVQAALFFGAPVGFSVLRGRLFGPEGLELALGLGACLAIFRVLCFLDPFVVILGTLGTNDTLATSDAHGTRGTRSTSGTRGTSGTSGTRGTRGTLVSGHFWLHVGIREGRVTSLQIHVMAATRNTRETRRTTEQHSRDQLKIWAT